MIIIYPQRNGSFSLMVVQPKPLDFSITTPDFRSFLLYILSNRFIMKKNDSTISLFSPEEFSHEHYCNVPCRMCGSTNKVLYVLGKFKGETFGSYRYLCVLCRHNLKIPPK